ncbi:MAG TPA: hypothetical protein EYG38_01910 [Verrucomicrobia bacterium]|nr:hypothetical protein [Verrucomicrobiota bacterium]
MGPLVILIWFSLVGSATIAGLVMAIKRGIPSLKWSSLLFSGSLLCYGFISAGMGISEGVWTFSSPGFFLMTGTGLLGLFSIGSGCVGLSRKKSVDKPFRL